MSAFEITHRRVPANGIELHLAECGPADGEAVILCHGFPELWYSWRHQLPALAAAGYRAIALDQRGYGQSDRPADVADYDIVHLTDDLLGVVDHLERDKAVFVGHDWGAPVVWSLAQRAPERVEAVVAMSVAHAPRAATSPVETLRALFGDRFFYMLYFQEPGRADADLAQNPREALRRFMAAIGGDGGGGEGDGPGPASALGANLPSTASFWDWIPPAPTLPPWLTEADLDVFAAEFERTGFTGGINWYRNIHRNWELSAHLAQTRIEMPALFVAGAQDPVLVMSDPSRMDGWVTDLRGKVIVPGAGHWIQQERPAEVNDALLGFLAGLP